MDSNNAGRILAALVICSGNTKGCGECPAYDPEKGTEEQRKICQDLLSDENVNKALETMRG